MRVNFRPLIFLFIGVLIFLWCLISPQGAYAYSIYRVLNAPTLSANTSGQALGVIQVDMPTVVSIQAYDVLTIHLPSEITMPTAGAISISATRTSATEEIVVPDFIGTDPNGLANTSMTATISANKRSIDISFNGTFSDSGPTNPGRFLIYITNVNVGSIEGDINAAIFSPSSSPFSNAFIAVGKIINPQPVLVAIKSTTKFATTVANIEPISVYETARYTLTPGTIIDFVLSSGFEWDESNTDQTVSIEGSWELAGSGNNAASLKLGSTSIPNIWYEISRSNPTTLRVTFLSSFVPTNNCGKVVIGCTLYNTLPKICVAGAAINTAAYILVRSPNNQNVTEKEMLIARYVDAESINANLADIKIDGVTLSSFNPDVVSYNVTLPFGTVSIPAVSASLQTENASISLYQSTNLGGTESERTAIINVKSPDQSVTKTYKVIFTVVKTSNPNCFIATAAYGSYLDPHVSALRQFRDNVLLQHSLGRWFVKEYYLHSPPIAAAITHHRPLRILTRVILTPVVFAIAYPKISAVFLLAIVLGAIVLTHSRKYLLKGTRKTWTNN